MSAALRFGFERALLHAVYDDVSNVSNRLDSAMIQFYMDFNISVTSMYLNRFYYSICSYHILMFDDDMS